CLFNNWKTVIPTLVQPFLQYLMQTLGKPVNIPSSSLSHCAQACELKQTMLICLYFNRKSPFLVHWRHTHGTQKQILPRSQCRCANVPPCLKFYFTMDYS
ncbi:hypothetical protein PAXINDRAFT_88681, partial [Paxillus involutus ATCC 200175]